MAPKIIHWIVLQLLLYRGNAIFKMFMQKHPNPATSAAAAPAVKPFYTVNIYQDKIYVYQVVHVDAFSLNKAGRPVTGGKRLAVYPQDQENLKLINQLYPNALVYGHAAHAA